MFQIAAYQGTSFISRLIRWQTRSAYSHIAIRFTGDMLVKTPQQHGQTRSVVIEAGNVIEAWKGGVRKAESLSAAHTPHTKVDLFELLSPLNSQQEQDFARFLCAQLGKSYDYGAIIRFLTREPENRWNKTKWFCSELAFQACLVAGRELLARTAAWEVSPAWIPRSNLLKFLGSEWTV